MKNSIIIIIALFSFSFMNAQSDMAFAFKGNDMAFGAFGEEFAQEEIIVKAAKTVKIATDFTGFKIQLTNTVVALGADHPMFIEFGGIALEEDFQSYNYLIGGFKSKEVAQDFINKIIQDRYPEAHIVEYKDGARTAQPVKVIQCFELMD